ncbi:uncharacterized protein METZ01_LOCUS341820, partial [marine metagenome]
VASPRFDWHPHGDCALANVSRMDGSGHASTRQQPAVQVSAVNQNNRL